MKQLRLFIDRSSLEAFDGDGKMAMTNLVFPSEPYNTINVTNKAKVTIYPF
jgi:levanase/fructan beta-fructosidase